MTSKKNNGTLNSPSSSRRNLDNLFLGSTTTAAILERTGVGLGKEQPDVVWAQQDECRSFDATRQRVAHALSDTLKKIHVTSFFGKVVQSNIWLSTMCHGSHHQDSYLDTCWDRMRAELEQSVEGRKHLAREQARVEETRATLFIKPKTCRARGMGWPTKEILVNG